MTTTATDTRIQQFELIARNYLETSIELAEATTPSATTKQATSRLVNLFDAISGKRVTEDLAKEGIVAATALTNRCSGQIDLPKVVKEFQHIGEHHQHSTVQEKAQKAAALLTKKHNLVLA